MLPAACGSNEKLQGRLFLSAIESSDGAAVGLAIDFIPTAGKFSPKKVNLAIDVVDDALFVGGHNVTSVCLRLPSRRLNLLAVDGKLDPTSRVSVRAFRVDADEEASGGGAGGGGGAASGMGARGTADAAGGEATGGMSGGGAGGGPAGGAGGVSGGSAATGGSAGTGGAATGGSVEMGDLPTSIACEGLELLDDAVWPTRGAQVGPRMGTGGSFTVGGSTTTAGSGGTGGSGTGGTGGSGGAGGAGGEMGGAPPEGGASGAAGDDAGAAGALSGQGGA